MVRSLYAAAVYMALGLISGVFYREYTRAVGFPLGEFSQLNVLHTHLLSLGMMVFLIVLGLDAIFGLSGRKSFTVFFWLYNSGLVVTITMLVVRGLYTVNGVGPEETSPAIPGLSGLGHIMLSGGLVALFVALGAAVKERSARTALLTQESSEAATPA